MLHDLPWRCLLLAATLAACAPARTCDTLPRSPASGGSENVLVVLLDDIGVDQVAAWGAHPDPPHTPTLDGLVEHGFRFDRAYANPTCSPTRASLLTGRHARRHGIGTYIRPRSVGHVSLPAAEVTLPERLGPEGWTSALVGKWHLSTFRVPQPTRAALSHGFDHHWGLLGNPDMATTGDGEKRGYTHWERVEDGVRSWDDRYLTTAQVDDALALIPTLPEPWFTLVATTAAHSPWEAPPPRLWRPSSPDPSPTDRFRGIVEALDLELGRLFASLDPDLLARTTVIVLGDNGTPPEVIRRPWPTRGKETLYEGGIRVPLVLSGPRVATPGRSDALVHVTDVFATVLDIAGLEPGPEVDGHSLLPHVDGSARERRCLLVERFHQNARDPNLRSAVVGPDHKLIRADGRLSLFAMDGAAWSEGVDLRGDLDGVQREAFVRLRRELRRFDRALR